MTVGAEAADHDAEDAGAGLEFVEDDQELCDEEEEAPIPQDTGEARGTTAAPVDSKSGTHVKVETVEADRIDTIKEVPPEPPAPANDVDDMAWEWVSATVVVPPSPDRKERQVMYTLAERHAASKPSKMCNHLTCMVKKTGKAAWCKTHRAVTENAKAEPE